MLGVRPVAVKLLLDCHPLFAVLHCASPATHTKLYWTGLISSTAVEAVIAIAECEMAAGWLAQLVAKVDLLVPIELDDDSI